MADAVPAHFAYHHIVDVDDADPDVTVPAIAAAIGEPARARMLYGLLDGRARTSTELAMIAGVTPSTASVHLQRLLARRLVNVFAQGKHRYYSLRGEPVAAALEALSVLAGSPRGAFSPPAPRRLRAARTCYDHIAGHLGVALHDRFTTLGWLSAPGGPSRDYDVSPRGVAACEALGIDVDALRAQRRRLAFACLDWSERRPHLGGALGAALLQVASRRRWVSREPDGRALTVTDSGWRELRARFGLRPPAAGP